MRHPYCREGVRQLTTIRLNNLTVCHIHGCLASATAFSRHLANNDGLKGKTVLSFGLGCSCCYCWCCCWFRACGYWAAGWFQRLSFLYFLVRKTQDYVRCCPSLRQSWSTTVSTKVCSLFIQRGTLFKVWATECPFTTTQSVDFTVFFFCSFFLSFTRKGL